MKVRKVLHFPPLLLIKLVEQANWEQGKVLGVGKGLLLSKNYWAAAKDSLKK